MTLDTRLIGLRAQDVYSGLQTVDQTSGLVAAELPSSAFTIHATGSQPLLYFLRVGELSILDDALAVADEYT